MSLDTSTPELRFAVDAVRRGCALARRVQTEMTSGGLTKGDRSPVTVGDFAIQAVVAKALLDTFPDAVLVAEESSAMLRETENEDTRDRVAAFAAEFEAGATAANICDWIDRGQGGAGDRFWCLDPIDGTKGYLRGGHYCVALALLEHGEVKLGVLGCPGLGNGCTLRSPADGALAIAVRGKGAWAAPMAEEGALSRLEVSSTDNPQRARLLRSYEAAHTNTGQIGQFAEALGVEADPVPMDSQAKYAVLASGGGEVLLRFLSPKALDYKEKIWDQAAGSIVIEEAGGRITDLDGKPLDFTQGRTLANNRGVCASNGALHDVALEAIRALS